MYLLQLVILIILIMHDITELIRKSLLSTELSRFSERNAYFNSLENM